MACLLSQLPPREVLHNGPKGLAHSGSNQKKKKKLPNAVPSTACRYVQVRRTLIIQILCQNPNTILSSSSSDYV